MDFLHVVKMSTTGGCSPLLIGITCTLLSRNHPSDLHHCEDLV